jgi:L-iditol 2-dehydrogenase
VKAVRCQHGDVALVDLPEPSGEGVRVKVVSAGICGSDLHLIGGPFPIPGTLGHEFAGVLPDGRVAAIEPLSTCGHCEFCISGDYNLCRRGPGIVLGTSALDGGMAEAVIVPERAIVPLPSGLEVRNACLVEPTAVAVHGLRIAGLRGGMRVAVIGAGTIGLCAAAAAVHAGAHVTVVARHDSQREAANRLGAVECSGEYDLVVDAAGTTSALERAVALCRPGATLLLLATYWDGLQLPGFDVSMKEIRIVPASMYSRAGPLRDVDAAAALLAARPEIADVLITHRFPLDAVREAFETARDRSSGAIKVVLEP